jgi:hypothetical protein
MADGMSVVVVAGFVLALRRLLLGAVVVVVLGRGGDAVAVARGTPVDCM